MTNTDDTAVPPEPPSSPASANGRGQTLWGRLRTMLMLRPASLRDDLEELLGNSPASDGSDISAAERTILQNVLKLGDLTVDDVMVPRADIVAVEANEPFSVLLARFVDAGHSRLPIYDEDLDNITGFVHVKDTLRRIVDVAPTEETGAETRVKVVGTGLRTKIGRLGLVREVLFVPPSMPVGDLLEQMQVKRVHMAIVIDEYGGTDGVVTIEDLLEAVVGEIEDEYDTPDAPLIRKLNANTYMASARAELGEVRAALGPQFDPGESAEDVETIGGLVFDLAGHVPAVGETIEGPGGFVFEVVQADGRQVQKLKIRRPRPAKPPPKRREAPRAEEDESSG